MCPRIRDVCLDYVPANRAAEAATRPWVSMEVCEGLQDCYGWLRRTPGRVEARRS